MRYFRAATAVYQGIAAQLDAAWGYPNAETKTERALPMADTLPLDGQGRVYLAVPTAYLDYILPGQLVPEMVSQGLIEEITEAQYQAALPEVTP